MIGRPVDEEASNPERLKASLAAVSPGSRIIHYDTLIDGANRAYSEYIEASNKLDRLEEIIAGL